MQLSRRWHRIRRSGLAAAVGIAAALGIASCGTAASQSGAESGSAPGALSVVASFYPLAYLAQEIGGDLVTVTDLTPTGGEAHDLELSPSQVLEIGAADLVVYLGGGFQPSVESAIAAQDVESYDGMGAAAPDQLRKGDSHVWFNPMIMASMGDQLADVLSGIYPSGADSFAENASAFRQRMESLNDSFSSGLAGCEGATLVTSHEAFGYLADAYGLRQVGVTGINPEAEPSPKRLREVSQIVSEYGVKTLFFEQSVAASTEQKLAESLGISTGRLQTLEVPPADGASYTEAMEGNLQALEQGLVCSE